MNNTIKKINEIIKSELKNDMPNIETSELEEEGKIYYMNGNNGTLFDYNVNEKLPDFMCFYKDGTCGIIKLRINKDASAHIYLYNYGEMSPFLDKDLPNQFSKDEIFDLAIILNKIMDENGIFDKSANDYNTDIVITNIEKEHFLNECNKINDNISREKLDTEVSARYGGFMISKNVLKGIPVRYSYREKSSISELNGWTIYSANDDDEYVSNSNNFQIVGIETIMKVCPNLLGIFDAPYGTDLCWMYEKKLFKERFVGFYDLKKNKYVTIDEILNGK